MSTGTRILIVVNSLGLIAFAALLLLAPPSAPGAAAREGRVEPSTGHSSQPTVALRWTAASSELEAAPLTTAQPDRATRDH